MICLVCGIAPKIVYTDGNTKVGASPLNINHIFIAIVPILGTLKSIQSMECGFYKFETTLKSI